MTKEHIYKVLKREREQERTFKYETEMRPPSNKRAEAVYQQKELLKQEDGLGIRSYCKNL